MFDIALKQQLGEFLLDVSFRSDSPVTALSGPSGAGKSSVAAAIAGLLVPERGRIEIGGRVLFDSASGIDVAPHRRGVRVVFQESRLFPHLTVTQNLLFGRWLAGKRRDQKFDEVVALLGIEPLLARRPRKLSGGERQRVALGRALLAEPLALLLDEPLASLDAARKDEIIPYLARLITAAPMPLLYVSHAQDEIERLAGTVVTMAGGRISGVVRRDAGGTPAA